MKNLYLNREPVEAPVLTDLEKKLAKKLSYEDFGDSDSENLITTSDSEWCTAGGYERVPFIKWEDRRQLGALITSLAAKHLLTVEEDEEEGTGLWFDCDALKELSE
jgi:hypothetical protein